MSVPCSYVSHANTVREGKDKKGRNDTGRRGESRNKILDREKEKNKLKRGFELDM